MTTRKKNSTYTRNEQCIINCDLTYAVQKIGGRWKLLLLDKLGDKKLRFNELKKEFSYMSERMLSLQLKAMEQDGLIKRSAYAETPPRVEYEMTELAKELVPILDLLRGWGRKQREAV